MKKIWKNPLKPFDKITQCVIKYKKQKKENKKMSWEGNVIKFERTRRELTQKDLSEIIGIPKRTIEDWETGRRTPPTYIVKLIVNFLRTM